MQKAALAGIKVYGMSNYQIRCQEELLSEKNENKQAKILIGYAGLSETEIAEALTVLERAWG